MRPPDSQRGLALAFLAAAAAAACAEPARWALSTEAQTSGTDALLQAVSPVDDRLVWVSGHRGTYAVTEDGGETWRARVVPGADTLQFRDVEAFDARRAYLMSAGPGPLSRIYRTDDGGSSWTLQFVAEDAGAFLDCMAFWDAEHGLAYGDAIDGVPYVLRTTDGAAWERVPPSALPAALEGEGGFAASGTCLETGGPGRAWIATGNGPRARVLSTLDGGLSWTAGDVPVVGGAAAGLTTIRFGRGGDGIALGGVIGGDTLRTANVALTRDGGATWVPGGALAMRGPAYGAALPTPGLAVAVGPGGLDWSADGGRSWERGDTLTHWAVGFAHPGAGWAVGPGGRITRLSFARR